MSGTTFRQDLVAGLVTVLEGYKAANPTLLRGVGTARPMGEAFEKPYAYVDGRTERVDQTEGTRQRKIAASVVLLDAFPSAEQTMDRLDALVDGLSDAFTAAPHMAGGNTVHTGGWNVQQTEVQIGEGIYRAEVFTFDTITALEPRL